MTCFVAEFPVVHLIFCHVYCSALLPDVENRTVLIEGVLFRTRYLGSTKIASECNPSKARRMLQAQEAVGQIKVETKHFHSLFCVYFVLIV